MRSRKRFGQHFLEPAWADKLVAAVAATPDDTFLEIGLGRGALTSRLAPQAKQIIAVEIDRELADAVASYPPNVRIVEGDALEMDLASLVAAVLGPVRVVGNLPYNVSTPILFAVLDGADEGRRFADATLMLQKEVVDRLVSGPGSGTYGTLAVQAGLVSEATRLLTLPPGAFRPPPKVTSAVVRLRFRPATVDVGDRKAFARVVRGVFLQRRKTVANALKPVARSFGVSALELLAKTGLDGSKRPEELTIEEFSRLSRAVL